MRHKFLPICSCIFCFIILISACNQSAKKQKLVERKNGKFIFHLRPSQSINITAKDGLKNLTFIPLEGTPKSILGSIKEIEWDSTTGYWYILNRNAITVFYKNGKFLKRIKEIGKGPGEYLQINNFILADGKYIEIMDGRQHKLIRYDLKMNKLISEKKISFNAWTYAHLSNGNYVFYTNKATNNIGNKKFLYKILVMDKSFKIIRSRFPFKVKLGQAYYSFNQPKTLISGSQKVHYNALLTDTIYAITPDSIQPAFFIDYGKFKLNHLNKKKLSSSGDLYKYLAKHNNEFIVGVTYLITTPSQISFNFIYNKHSYLFLFNKNNHKARIIRNIKYGSEKINLPKPIQIAGSDYLGIYSWARLQKLSLKKLDKDTTAYSSLIKGKQEYQNPVLVLYNFNLNKIP